MSTIVPLIVSCVICFLCQLELPNNDGKMESPDMPNIFIIDDEPDIIELLSMELQLQGYNISTYNDGDAAMTNLKDQPCDLVIVDLFMPKKNGLEVALFIRNELPDNKKNIPIIGITGGNGLIQANQSSDKIEKFVNVVIQKPIDYPMLNKAVKSLIAA